MTAPESKNWTCPFCDRPQTLTRGQEHRGNHQFHLSEHAHGSAGIITVARACANSDCRELTVDLLLCSGEADGNYDWKPLEVISSHRLRPEGTAKPIPEYVPAALREDYVEACLIRDRSPKASATLSRRCLQGMIRDFAKVTGKTLFAEIRALSSLMEEGKAPQGVSIETVEALDHVRSIGNIGAHMEKDIDQIIPVDAGEAQALIDLIELLFDEWYVARHTRAQKLARVKQIAESKAALKLEAGSAPSEG